MNLFKEYQKYIQDNPDGYWSKRRVYGWGWVPATWQGWVLTAAYLILIIIISFRLTKMDTWQDALRFFVLPLVVLTGIFIFIAYKTGESPKWSWGIRDAKNAPSDDNTSD